MKPTMADLFYVAAIILMILGLVLTVIGEADAGFVAGFGAAITAVIAGHV